MSWKSHRFWSLPTARAPDYTQVGPLTLQMGRLKSGGTEELGQGGPEMLQGAGCRRCWGLACSQPFLPTPSLELCSATTRYLHFCKVMSSADNGFSVPGGAEVPDIVPWRRGSGKQIVHPSGMGVLSRPPPHHIIIPQPRLRCRRQAHGLRPPGLPTPK